MLSVFNRQCPKLEAPCCSEIETDKVPDTALLDLDKRTFKPPWDAVPHSIDSANETEISFSLDNEVIHDAGTLNRVTGRLEYNTTWKPKPQDPWFADKWRFVGVCKPAKPLF